MLFSFHQCMGEAPLSFDGPELMLGDLLPAPIIFRIFLHSFLVFLQGFLINGALYEASVFVGGTKVPYGADLAGLPVLVMLDLVARLIVNGSIGRQYLSVGTGIGIHFPVVFKIDHGIKAVVLGRVLLR